jgi:hypothetical protein
MDLETFFTTVYVLIDDWYTEHVVQNKPKVGAPARMSDSEVLTVAIVGQWRVGVPWRSERGLVRYLQAHGRDMFPTMLQRSAFNRRVRYLWGVLAELQHIIAKALEAPTNVYECLDAVPIPAGTLGQYTHDPGHWLWDSTIGRGPQGWFWGDHLLVSCLSSGAITGWLVAAAHINDRWLMEAFLSARSGQPRLIEPPRRKRSGRKGHILPPVGFIGGWRAVGRYSARAYLADKGFNGKKWSDHWWRHYQATVITVPSDNALTQLPWSTSWKRWLASHRQIIETVFALLDQVFGIKALQAHSRWGQYTRIAAKTVAFNLGLYINRLLERPLLALGTLLC